MKRMWMVLGIGFVILLGCKKKAEPEGSLFVSGRIDGDTVDISSKIAGRIVEPEGSRGRFCASRRRGGLAFQPARRSHPRRTKGADRQRPAHARRVDSGSLPLMTKR